MAKPNPVPPGLHTLTPQLTVEGAHEAMAFYARAFGAEQIAIAPDPTGKKIWHGHMRVGDSAFFVNDTFPEMGGTAQPVSLWLYIDDVDAAFKRAVDAGARPAMPPMDMFWGDRMARVVDRWGNAWNLATHVKDLTPEEIKRAQDEFVAASAKPQ